MEAEHLQQQGLHCSVLSVSVVVSLLVDVVSEMSVDDRERARMCVDCVIPSCFLVFTSCGVPRNTGSATGSGATATVSSRSCSSSSNSRSTSGTWTAGARSWRRVPRLAWAPEARQGLQRAQAQAQGPCLAAATLAVAAVAGASSSSSRRPFAAGRPSGSVQQERVPAAQRLGQGSACQHAPQCAAMISKSDENEVFWK
jgi:hypothetical protein